MTIADFGHLNVLHKRFVDLFQTASQTNGLSKIIDLNFPISTMVFGMENSFIAQV